MTRKSPSALIVSNDTLFTGYVSVSKVTFEAAGPNGQMMPPTSNTVVTVKDGVMVIPYDPKLDKVLLTEEFRIATVTRDEEAWARIAPEDRPSGRLLGTVLGGVKPGEDFEAAARRETLEESGVTAGRSVKGPTFHTWGAMSPNYVTVYVMEFDGTKVKDGAASGLAEEVENIAIRTVSLEQLEQSLDETSLSRTMEGSTQAAVSWFLRHQPEIKAAWEGTGPIRQNPRQPLPDAPSSSIS